MLGLAGLLYYSELQPAGEEGRAVRSASGSGSGSGNPAPSFPLGPLALARAKGEGSNLAKLTSAIHH